MSYYRHFTWQFLNLSCCLNGMVYRIPKLFTNVASALCLVGVLWAESHETWIRGRRYFGMEEYWN